MIISRDNDKPIAIANEVIITEEFTTFIYI